jgi:hypothetical protein
LRNIFRRCDDFLDNNFGAIHPTTESLFLRLSLLLINLKHHQAKMGLLTILKKVKLKEKEMRLLVLYVYLPNSGTPSECSFPCFIFISPPPFPFLPNQNRFSYLSLSPLLRQTPLGRLGALIMRGKRQSLRSSMAKTSIRLVPLWALTSTHWCMTRIG